MKNIICAILLLIVLSNTVNSTIMPDDIEKSIIFIFTEINGEMMPLGTGFFTAVFDSINDKSIFFPYLVTAKHVLLDSKKNFFKTFYLRLNTIDGHCEYVYASMSDSSNSFIKTHHDPIVDIVVLPVAELDHQKYQIKYIPVDWILTREAILELPVSEGDEVFFLGLLAHFYGQSRNYPVYRFGNVSLISQEKIPWRTTNVTEMHELLLIESHSIGGNSGSPVFHYMGFAKPSGDLVMRHDYHLLGIIKGSFLDVNLLEVIDTTLKPIYKDNIGISAVIPAYLLHDILFSEELVEKRRNALIKGIK